MSELKDIPTMDESISDEEESEFDADAGQQYLEQLRAATDPESFIRTLTASELDDLGLAFSSTEEDFPNRSYLAQLWCKYAWEINIT